MNKSLLPCKTGKIKHKKERTAWKQGCRLYVAEKATGFNVYKCPHCSYFHVTSQHGKVPKVVRKNLDRMLLIKKYFRIG